MLSVRVNEFIKEISLKIEKVSKPEAKKGFVVVKVYSAACNPVDTLCAKGNLVGRWKGCKLPFSLGYDFAGKIEEIHSSDLANGFRKDDRVFAVNWGKGSHWDEDELVGGAFSEFILISIHKLSLIPSSVSYHQAAAIALVGTTAFQGLFECGKVKEGSKVLIIGGSSSVGCLAIQLAKLKGASLVVATSSSRGLEFVSQFKPHMLINYNEEKWHENEKIKDFDVVFDCVGEKESFENSRKVLKSNGRFVVIVSGSTVGSNPLAHPPLEFASFFCLSNDCKVQDELMELVANKSLSIPIENEFDFTLEGIKAMFDKQDSKKSFGKNVLKIVLE